MTLDLAMISWLDTKAQTIKAKIDKWDCIKLKNFGASKDTINRVKRYGMGENICESGI